MLRLRNYLPLKLASNHLVNYPTPINISYLWSFGSLAGIFLGLQIVTGLFLAMHFVPHADMAFQSVEHIMRDVQGGWLFRYMHANGASFMFMCLYAHIARGLYFQSYKAPREYVWTSGVTLFILTAATAFLGYVLPWGQMSYWGATVITNIASSIPVIGEPLVLWVWGGFSVDTPTLNRFFVLHFLLPFVIAGLATVHLLFLHRVGSSNPMGLDASDNDVSRFYPYFFLKDTFGFILVFTVYMAVVCLKPNMFGHPDNYIPASPSTTPSHIVPEWYFLFAYSILKAIPSKLGGAIAMLGSMVSLYAIPFVDFSKNSFVETRGLWLFFFNLFILDVMLLTWIGGKAPSLINTPINRGLTLFYFAYIFVIIPGLAWYNNHVIEKGRHSGE